MTIVQKFSAAAATVAAFIMGGHAGAQAETVSSIAPPNIRASQSTITCGPGTATVQTYAITNFGNLVITEATATPQGLRIKYDGRPDTRVDGRSMLPTRVMIYQTEVNVLRNQFDLRVMSTDPKVNGMVTPEHSLEVIHHFPTPRPGEAISPMVGLQTNIYRYAGGTVLAGAKGDPLNFQNSFTIWLVGSSAGEPFDKIHKNVAGACDAPNKSNQEKAERSVGAIKGVRLTHEFQHLRHQ
jgi:hypothetical protein